MTAITPQVPAANPPRSVNEAIFQAYATAAGGQPKVDNGAGAALPKRVLPAPAAPAVK